MGVWVLAMGEGGVGMRVSGPMGERVTGMGVCKYWG